MMLAFPVLLVLAIAAPTPTPLPAPFWEARPPADWTDGELHGMLTASPWAEPALSAKNSGDIHVFLATARPIQEAEEELARRAAKQRQPEQEPPDNEYQDFLRDNAGQYIVLAVTLPNPKVLENRKELQFMEDECVLKVGGKKYNIVGHFPPLPSDPYLRLVFPRVVSPEDKAIRFELYLPSAENPYRAAEFRIQDLVYKGAPEM